ncbi:MAG: hypothetical protein WCP81_08050 [Actinomycetes bacterium]
MPDTYAIDDERGVDIARIRELLAMTTAERVAHMVRVANVLRSIADSAEASRR